MKPVRAGSSQLRGFAVTATRIVTLALLSGSLAQRIEAQQAASIRVGVSVETTSVTTKPAKDEFHAPDKDTTSNRTTRTVRGALIGAGVGAATGFVAAIIATHKATVTDHSEDGLAYMGFTAFGALVGFLVGGIVGFIRE